VLDALASGHEVRLAVGRDDGTAAAPVPRDTLRGLDARDGRRVAGLDALIGEFRPDLVHVHNVVNPQVLEAVALRAEAGLPALATVQDHRPFCPGRGKWTRDGRRCRQSMSPDRCADCFDDAAYGERLLALTGRRLAALSRLPLVVLSRYMAGELTAAGVVGDSIHVVPPFVHGLEPGPAGDPCVLFVGRLVEAKGVWDAAEAWRRSGVTLPLVFAGTGSAREALEAAGHRVTGWLDRPRLARAYRGARALVLPSRWQEPFGIVGLEAAAMGTSVAAWDSGGIAEWHPGHPPLAPWGDLDALAAALRDAVETRATPPRSATHREAAMARLLALYGRLAGG